jgi:hypothetical protein
MKSTKIHLPKNLTEFWEWFRRSSDALAVDPQNVAILSELDARVTSLSPSLSWEIGPGRFKPWQFVVSPDLDRAQRDVARQIISRAPELPDWEFHSARQPKDWDFKFELQLGGEGKTLSLDASRWTFVLLEYPNGIHEILIKGFNLPALTRDQREQAAEIVLESILGEETFLDSVDEFDLVDQLDSQFVGQDRPIQELRRAVTGPPADAPAGNGRPN